MRARSSSAATAEIAREHRRPPRPTCTRGTAASCPRSRRGGTSSSSSPVVREALDEAGATLDDVDRVAVTPGPGADRRAARRPVRPRRRSPGRGGCRSSRSTTCTATSPRSTSAATPLEPPFVCLLASGGHTLLLDVRERGRFASSARRSTTPPARRSTRARACSVSAIRAARRSTASRATGDPDAFAFPVARVPGLDFSFSGLKTALLYAVRDLEADELEAGAPTSPRATSGRSCARSSSGRWTPPAHDRADRGRRRRRRELRAARRAARRRRPAARALHRQRRDDRLGRAVRRGNPVPPLPCPRCLRLGSRGPAGRARRDHRPRRDAARRRLRRQRRQRAVADLAGGGLARPRRRRPPAP